MGKLDTSKIMAGFRGAFFWDTGDQMGECRSWGVDATITNTDESVLDDVLDHPVWQSSTFALTFSVLRVTDDISLRILDAVRNRQQIFFKFIGEVYRPDGQTGRYVINRVTPDGTQRLFGMERGTTYTSDYTWRVDQVPDVDSALTP